MTLSIMTLGITTHITMTFDAAYCYPECRYVKCQYAKCHYAKCHYAECHYAKCHDIEQTANRLQPL
jgi:hypothetical protein